jgi:hypothetical protein
MINLEEVEFMRGNDAMAFKVRTESDLLKCLRILNLRMELTEDEKKYYLNLKKATKVKLSSI